MRISAKYIVALLLLLVIGYSFLNINKTIDDCDWISNYPVYGIKLGDTVEEVEQKHKLLLTVSGKLKDEYHIRDILPSGCPITLWAYENKVISIDVRTKDSSRKTSEEILAAISEKFSIIDQEESTRGTMTKFLTHIDGNQVSITYIYNEGVRQVFVTYTHRQLMDAFNEENL